MEIKFKRYHFNDGVCSDASTCSVTVENNEKAIDCLFTGIQDNNGVDAYAGDPDRIAFCKLLDCSIFTFSEGRWHRSEHLRRGRKSTRSILLLHTNGNHYDL